MHEGPVDEYGYVKDRQMKYRWLYNGPRQYQMPRYSHKVKRRGVLRILPLFESYRVCFYGLVLSRS